MFCPVTPGNEGTEECLTRCEEQKLKHLDEWTDSQKERTKQLFLS